MSVATATSSDARTADCPADDVTVSSSGSRTMHGVPPRRSSTAPTYLGIDLGATKIEVVVTGADLTPLSRARAATPLRGGPPAVVTAIETAVAEALAAAPHGRLLAAGIGGAELVIFEESSHLAFIEERERYLQVVGDFLAQTESRIISR